MIEQVIQYGLLLSLLLGLLVLGARLIWQLLLLLLNFFTCILYGLLVAFCMVGLFILVGALV